MFVKKSLQKFNSTTRFTSVSDWLRAVMNRNLNPKKFKSLNKIQNSAFKSQFYICFTSLRNIDFEGFLATSDLFVQLLCKGSL